MGQYYRSVFLTQKNKPKAYAVTYDFGSGAKLMEHSWMKNDFVRFVERQLMNEPQKIVWTGDYADNEDPTTLKTEELKLLVDESSDYWNLKKLKSEGVNLFALTDNGLCAKITHNEDVKDKYKHNFTSVAPLNAIYLINYDKKQFVDKSKMPKDKDGWQIHPLPLLTAEGNGRGGGDYGEEYPDYNLVGVWARDMIGVSTKKSDIPKDFTELTVKFSEKN